MKRFTETQKWSDPWFRRLKPEIKNLWQWLLDNCDSAGIVDVDLPLASFQVGFQYSTDSLLELGDRIQKLPSGKHFIPKFIPFQYGQLSEDCKPHKPVFVSLEKHGLKGYPKGIDTLQEKEKEKEQEKEDPKSRGTDEEFRSYAATIGLLESDGSYLIDHFRENGWKRGKEPIKDWKAAMRKWKTANYFPSQKQNGNKTSTGTRPLF
jgi:hypothetical protein